MYVVVPDPSSNAQFKTSASPKTHKSHVDTRGCIAIAFMTRLKSRVPTRSLAPLFFNPPPSSSSSSSSSPPPPTIATGRFGKSVCIDTASDPTERERDAFLFSSVRDPGSTVIQTYLAMPFIRSKTADIFDAEGKNKRARVVPMRGSS